MRGLPTVCFAGACGRVEVLAADPRTSSLVVPYMDTYGAADVICRLAASREALSALADEVRRVALKAYDMVSYVRQVDAWGADAKAALRDDDLATLAEARAIDADLALPCEAIPPGALGVERHVLQQWAVVGASVDQVSNRHFRRPCAGFHPQLYAQAHPDACVKDRVHPLAHWLRAGRPVGPWSRQVFGHSRRSRRRPESSHCAARALLPYGTAHDLAMRLARNTLRCGVFLTTDTAAKADDLRAAFAGHRGSVDVRVTPNRGRDVGPFLTALATEIQSGGYDVFGHVHGKQSHDAQLGNLWRDFLWENLVGGSYSMIDVIAAALTGRLIWVDHGRGSAPRGVGFKSADRGHWQHIVGYHLEDFFDFPLGNMFWPRPDALQPLPSLH